MFSVVAESAANNMPSELFKKKNGDTVMYHGVASGLFKGRLLSVDKASRHRHDREDEPDRRHEERHRHGRHQNRDLNDNRSRHTSETQQTEVRRSGQSVQQFPSMNSHPVVPYSYGAQPEFPPNAYYTNEPTRPPVVRNRTTQSPIAQAGRDNYIQNVFYNGNLPGSDVDGYRQAQPNYQVGNGTGGGLMNEPVAHDPRSCELHPECLKAQLDAARKAKTVYVGGSVRSATSAMPSNSTSVPVNTRSQASTSSVRSSNTTWSPEYQYTQQKRMEEFAVANLARVYAPNGFGDLDIEPDRNFDMLDCKLLTLLNVKHDVDKGRALQTEFYKATGRMVDTRLLEQELDFADSMTNFTAGSRFSARDREILAYCNERRQETKRLAIQADFFREAGRMVDLQILKQKLG